MGLLPTKETNVVPIREKNVGQDDFDEQTPYHIRKGIELIGAKLEGNNVVIPIFNAQKKRVGQQTITPDGSKKFSKNMQADGAFGVCGKIAPGKLYVAEGYATCASIYSATQTNTIFALSSGNLPKVCEAIQEAFPKVELVVAADNDEAGIKAAKASGRPYATPKKQGYDWNDVFVEQGEAAVREGLKGARLPNPMFTHVSDIEMKPPQWLIDGMLEKEALTMCFGSPGAGKTFAVLDMALSIAAGKDWHGKDVEQGLVLYIAGEGHAGFARRVAAWSTTHNVDLTDVPFYKSNSAVIVNDQTSSEELHQELQKMASAVGKPKLIVLDTLARTMIGDENSSEKVGEYIKALDNVKAEYGCTVLIVHHTGHSSSAQSRARGSSALLGALDAEFKVAPWGDLKILIENTKMKDAEEPEPMAFLKVTVPLTTPHGEETSSLALEYTPDKPRDKSDPEYIKEVVLDQMDRLNEFGEVKRKDLREAVAIELDKSQRQADRDIKRLIDKGILTLNNGMVLA